MTVRKIAISFCNNIRPKFGTKADKKKATVEGRPRPLIFHPNLPKILKVTSPFLGQAVYS